MLKESDLFNGTGRVYRAVQSCRIIGALAPRGQIFGLHRLFEHPRNQPAGWTWLVG
jgi:hypothetical protein